MTLAEQHPHPGEAPPHPGAEPELDLTGGDKTCLERRAAWREAARKHNEHLAKLRRYYVAAAVDELLPPGKTMGQLTPVERLAVAVGCGFLDGVGLPAGDPLAGLFGAFNL
jgi:hypothetical protein